MYETSVEESAALCISGLTVVSQPAAQRIWCLRTNAENGGRQPLNLHSELAGFRSNKTSGRGVGPFAAEQTSNAYLQVNACFSL
jgi:hypothetical protein